MARIVAAQDRRGPRVIGWRLDEPALETLVIVLLLAVSAMVTHNLQTQFLGDTEQRHKVRAARVVVVLAGAVAT